MKGRSIKPLDSRGEVAEHSAWARVGNVYHVLSISISPSQTSLDTAGNTGLGLTIRTGLADATSAFRIPAIAESAFTKPIPIGPLTIWQRVFGTQYTAAGALSLETGTFVRTGVNWNQVGIYGFDASVTDTTAGGFYPWLDR